MVQNNRYRRHACALVQVGSIVVCQQGDGNAVHRIECEKNENEAPPLAQIPDCNQWESNVHAQKGDEVPGPDLTDRPLVAPS